MPFTPSNLSSSRWLALLTAILLLSCTPKDTAPEKTAPDVPTSETLAKTELQPAESALARAHLDANRPDLALAILAAHPAHEQTVDLVNRTRWYLPTTQIEHPGLDIHHIAIHGYENSLWVALSKDSLHTLIRWNFDTLEIDAVLFPTRDPLRVFVLSPTASHAVVTRGDISLLIDAQSLKPIADLGKIPTDITPESAIAFSRDSLLLAHPTDSAWHIRDTATGEIIRIIGLEEIPASPVLATHINSHRLRLLTANGTLIDAPISPVEPILIEPFEEEPLEILHAHLLDWDRGDTAIIIRDLGPHEPPVAIEFQLTGNNRLDAFDTEAWTSEQAHSKLPGLAAGLLRYFDPPPLTLTEFAIVFNDHSRAPLLTETKPIAYATNPTDGSLATAEPNGRITHHHILLPAKDHTTESLTAIAGHQYHRDTTTFEPRTADARLTTLGYTIFRTTTPAHLLPLWHRLADALPPDSPDLKTLAEIGPSPTDQTPAHTLASALAEDASAPIIAALESAADIPPTLRILATSHIHQRQGNTAAAFAPYHKGFPHLDSIRLREDWHGWEQPDFKPAVTALKEAYEAIITTITIDPEADDTIRQETLTRLTDPGTFRTLGRARYATACLDAANVLTTIAGEAEHALSLATLARHHGAPITACLRVEALALTALEKFPEARMRWIDLITNHPAETHLPSDYAEAAYTAFENADPRQALEILITGMHRFGRQSSFALRCGWIALLAGHPDHARAFLLKGLESGFAEDELEHATALLATTAVLVHDAAAAAAHFQDLIALDPTWADPETLEALSWPDHLKAPLIQLTW